MRLTDDEFEDVVEEALESLPPAFAPYMEDVVVDVEPGPDVETCRRVGLADPRGLMGLFHGVPVTQRSVEQPLRFPNRVVIYQRNLERICRSRSQLLHEIRRTVLHEVGHHFGLSERDLSDLGYG